MPGSLRGETLRRFFADGTLDAGYARDLNSGFFLGSFALLTALPDGRALMLGVGIDSVDLYRFSADGSFERGFPPRLPSLDGGASVAVQPDGKVLLLGVSRGFGGVQFNSLTARLLRLNVDGTTDASFRPALTPDREELPLRLQPDGKILVFSAGVPRRLHADGNLDESFVPAGEVSYLPVPFVLQPADGKLLVGHVFSQPSSAGGGEPVRQFGLVRLHVDGSRDDTFQYRPDPELIGISPFLRPPPLLLVQADGKLVVGVSTSFLSGGADTLLRLRADGTMDVSFNSAVRVFNFTGPGSGQTGAIRALALDGGGRLLVGGGTSRFGPDGQTAAGFLARLVADPSAKRADLAAQLRGVRGNLFPPGTVVTRYPLRATLRLENRGNRAMRGATLAAYVSDRTDYASAPRTFRPEDDPSLVALPLQAIPGVDGALAGLRLRYLPGEVTVALDLPRLPAGGRLDLPLKWNLSLADAEAVRGKSLLLVISPPPDPREADDTDNVAEAHPLP